MSRYAGWIVALVVLAALSAPIAFADGDPLEDRVAALEAQVAGLEATVRVNESPYGMDAIKVGTVGAGKAAAINMYATIADIVITEMSAISGDAYAGFTLAAAPGGHSVLYLGASQLVLAHLEADPAPPQEGAIWYRSDLQEVRIYLAGEVRVLETSSP